MTMEWGAVRETRDRRRVAYWRLGTDELSPGSVSRTEDGQWRAKGSPDPRRGYRHRDRQDLGTYPTRRQAERAVEAYAAR
jgi:hypothetical protein